MTLMERIGLAITTFLGLNDKVLRAAAQEELAANGLGEMLVEKILSFPKEDMRGTFLEAFRNGMDETDNVPLNLRPRAVEIMGEEVDKLVEAKRAKLASSPQLIKRPIFRR